jgi:predicted lipid-binding transport protein (Tim44 family)
MTIHRRRLPLAIAAATVAVLFAASTVDARPGRGSAGSRGTRAEQSIPQTPTTAPRQVQPGAGAPSAAQPGAVARPGAAPAATAAAQGSFARNMMLGFGAGLLGAGLFGLLSGQGFFAGLGSLMGVLGFLLQIALIAGAVFLVMRLIRGRQQPAASGPVPAGMPRQMMNPAPGAMAGAAAAQAPVAGQDRVGVQQADFQEFGTALQGLMWAYGQEDMATIREGVTPELAAHFERELQDNAANGVVNRLGRPELLQGDLAESWYEDNVAWATVAMRYRLTDAIIRRDTGAVVSGDLNRPVEVVEHWTFTRAGVGQPWLLAAIQEV